jgi:hypothetical protein
VHTQTLVAERLFSARCETPESGSMSSVRGVIQLAQRK